MLLGFIGHKNLLFCPFWFTEMYIDGFQLQRGGRNHFLCTMPSLWEGLNKAHSVSSDEMEHLPLRWEQEGQVENDRLIDKNFKMSLSMSQRTDMKPSS